jgi:PAS domain S-box-containing protein
MGTPGQIVDLFFSLWYGAAMNVPALMATYQLRQREYLLRITRAMTSRLDLPSLLELILSSAAEMVAAPAGLIVLHEPAAASIPPSMNDQISVEAEPQVRIRTTYGIPDQLLPAFGPLLRPSPPPLSPDEEDEESDGTSQTLGERYRRDLERRVHDVEEKLGSKLGQVLGLPLLFEEELLGVIYLFRGGSAFTQLDWEFLEGFAYQAAIAVRNARLYAQLSTERSRLAAIIENSADGILLLRPDRRIDVINQALATMLGCDPGSVIGKLCSQVLELQNVVGDDLCADGVVAIPSEGLRCEGDLVRHTGGNLAVTVTYTPLFDDQERLTDIIANVIDITRFREEEEMKSTFVSIISHELKTPVALVKGYAQTLARPDAAWDPETARQSLQIIEEEADRLEALINNLLDVSRIQAGDLRLDVSDVDMRRLLQRVAQDYGTQTQQHQIEIDLPDDLPIIAGDEERLRQVFTNLVGNAIKYSPDGGLIRIGGWVDRREEDGKAAPRLVIYVADEGIGIPEYELPKIFDRFYRVDSGLRRRTAGVGLGLFLINAIVEAHQGEIWVRSELHKGTTFSVALPIDEESEGIL